jgi:hypothetical protein
VQPGALEEAQAGAVHERSHEPEGSRQAVQDGRGFRAGEYQRQPDRLLGPYDVPPQACQLAPEDRAVLCCGPSYVA